MEQAERIRLLAMDVDGVLTDGRIILGGEGQEFKSFDVKDGMGISLARKAGLIIAWITGRSSEALKRRAVELHCDHCLQGVADKKAALEKLIIDNGFSWQETAYIGDDLNDLAPMAAAGFSVAVGDAVPETVRTAHYHCIHSGGRGAVRETVEVILRAQGRWDSLVNGMREGTESAKQ